ncbi:unnamed protein product, partial [Prorocentrum cordatum]
MSAAFGQHGCWACCPQHGGWAASPRATAATVRAVAAARPPSPGLGGGWASVVTPRACAAPGAAVITAQAAQAAQARGAAAPLLVRRSRSAPLWSAAASAAAGTPRVQLAAPACAGPLPSAVPTRALPAPQPQPQPQQVLLHGGARTPRAAWAAPPRHGSPTVARAWAGQPALPLARAPVATVPARAAGTHAARWLEAQALAPARATSPPHSARGSFEAVVATAVASAAGPLPRRRASAEPRSPSAAAAVCRAASAPPGALVQRRLFSAPGAGPPAHHCGGGAQVSAVLLATPEPVVDASPGLPRRDELPAWHEAGAGGTWHEGVARPTWHLARGLGAGREHPARHEAGAPRPAREFLVGCAAEPAAGRVAVSPLEPGGAMGAACGRWDSPLAQLPPGPPLGAHPTGPLGGSPRQSAWVEELRVLETPGEVREHLSGRRALHVKGFGSGFGVEWGVQQRQDEAAVQALERFRPDCVVVDGDPWGSGFQRYIKAYADTQVGAGLAVPELVWVKGVRGSSPTPEEREKHLGQAREWADQGLPVVVSWLPEPAIPQGVDRLFGAGCWAKLQGQSFDFRGAVRLLEAADPDKPEWLRSLWGTAPGREMHLAIEEVESRAEKRYFEKKSFENAAKGYAVYQHLRGEGHEPAVQGAVSFGGEESVLLEFSTLYLCPSSGFDADLAALFPFSRGRPSDPTLPAHEGGAFRPRRAGAAAARRAGRLCEEALAAEDAAPWAGCRGGAAEAPLGGLRRPAEPLGDGPAAP